MEIKGTAVKSIPEFVKQHFPLEYQKWLNSLPVSSYKIMNGLIFINNWYPLKDSLVVPMKIISDLFYSGDEIKAARIMGHYSARVALTGIYKFFIQFGSPKYIIERGGRIFGSYFKPSELVVVNVTNNSLLAHLTIFPEPDEMVENNIAGWMEEALEISGCKAVNIEITKSLARNDKVTEFRLEWK
jgi:hypothetical protein